MKLIIQNFTTEKEKFIIFEKNSQVADYIK